MNEFEQAFYTKDCLIEIMLEGNLIKSKNEGRRLIKNGAVEFNKRKIFDTNFVPEESGILRIGKHRFLKIIVKYEKCTEGTV